MIYVNYRDFLINIYVQNNFYKNITYFSDILENYEIFENIYKIIPLHHTTFNQNHTSYQLSEVAIGYISVNII